MTAAQADAGAFGTYLEEGLGYVAFALRLQTPDPSGLTFPALVSLGYYSGNASVGLPAYVQSASGIPCLAVQMMVTNPCFETQPVDLLVDLNKALPFGLPSHWKLRVWFNDLTLSGAFSTEGTPHIQQGLLHAQVDLLQAVEDVKMIIVDEYCKGKIATCAPGTGGLPTCPQTPDEGFFPQIPTQCDATFFGIGMRLILTMLESAPEGQGSVKASFVSMVPVETKTTQAGGIHPDVFSVEPGRNCYEASQSFR